jgi:hypothetical protein
MYHSVPVLPPMTFIEIQTYKLPALQSNEAIACKNIEKHLSLLLESAKSNLAE